MFDLQRLDPSTQTLYAEFLDRLHLQAAHRSVGDLPGSFVSKKIKGRHYLYFQFSKPGGLTEQIYLGEKSKMFQKLIDRFKKERPDKEKEQNDVARLCAQLRAGGAATMPHAVARVLEALGNSGIFRQGGMLVGTHAFTVIGNSLGVHWPPPSTQTQDVDVAIGRVDVALPERGTNIQSLFEKLDMGFIPVPPLNFKQPTTSFKVRGNPLRVDILTPIAGSHVKVLFLKSFNTGATGLPYLDYLFEEAVEGGIISGDGVLVRVPSPARFALHKLLISQLRAGAHLIRTSKDILQASWILSVLAEERPGDISLAWEAAVQRGRTWTRAIQNGLAALSHQAPQVFPKIQKFFISK